MDTILDSIVNAIESIPDHDILVSDIQVCPIDDHMTMGFTTTSLVDVVEALNNSF